MCDLKANDRVECIDNRPAHRSSLVMPELGRLYTVKSVRWADGGYSVRLHELCPECHRGGACRCGKCGWDAARFRRVYRPSRRKLAIFTKMLRDAEAESAKAI